MCFSQRLAFLLSETLRERRLCRRFSETRQDRGARKAGWVDLRSNPEILLLCLLNLGAHQKEG
jgi:hypothetical protein